MERLMAKSHPDNHLLELRFGNITRHSTSIDHNLRLVQNYKEMHSNNLALKMMEQTENTNNQT